MTTILKVTTEDTDAFLVEELRNIQRSTDEDLKVIIVSKDTLYIQNNLANSLDGIVNNTSSIRKVSYKNLSIEIYPPNNVYYYGKEFHCSFVDESVTEGEKLYLLSRVRKLNKCINRYYILNKVKE